LDFILIAPELTVVVTALLVVLLDLVVGRKAVLATSRHLPAASSSSGRRWRLTASPSSSR